MARFGAVVVVKKLSSQEAGREGGGGGGGICLERVLELLRSPWFG